MSYKLLVFGHRSLIKNIKQTAVTNILKICILCQVHKMHIFKMFITAVLFYFFYQCPASWAWLLMFLRPRRPILQHFPSYFILLSTLKVTAKSLAVELLRLNTLPHPKCSTSTTLRLIMPLRF